MGGALSDVVRATVGLVLCAAGVAKLFDRQRFSETLIKFPVIRSIVRSPRIAKSAAVALAATEVFIGSFFVVGYRVELVSFAVVGLLTLFTIALMVTLLLHEDVECGCFGSASSKPVKWTSVARNLVLIVAAVLAGQLSDISLDSVLRRESGYSALSGLVLVVVQTGVLVAGVKSFSGLRSIQGYAPRVPPLPNSHLGEVWEGPRDAGHGRNRT